MHAESHGGIVLMMAAVTALVWANPPVWESCHDVWGTYLSIRVGDWSFRLPVHHFIDGALITVFLFVAGLVIALFHTADVSAAALGFGALVPDRPGAHEPLGRAAPGSLRAFRALSVGGVPGCR